MTPLDALLALGASLRATRFVTTDDVPGGWWIREPLTNASVNRLDESKPPGHRLPWWDKYLDGLTCPHCVAAHTTTWVLTGYALTRGTPRGRAAWRAVTGWLTLAYVTGHTAARLGDHP